MLTENRKFRFFAAALLVLGMVGHAAWADDDDDDERHGWRYEKYGERSGGEGRSRAFQAAPVNAKFQQECSSCHIAYAPRLLSAESWRKVMSGLTKHFGTDASLDAQDAKEITDFLVNNASRRWRDSTAPLRISESAWFRRKHDSREVNPAVWKNPQVKSPSNCGACHPRAEQGDFNEHDIRMPR